MKKINNTLIPGYIGFGIIIVFVLAIISLLIIINNDNKQRNKLLDDAYIISVAIDIDGLKSLSTGKPDLSSPFYKTLKKQLFNIRTSNDSYKFLYLLGIKEDKETIFFFIDSQMPNSSDYVPSGEIYSEVPDEYIAAFKTKEKMTVGPITDRWGTVVTALIPIVDKKNGEIIAVLGLDIIDNRWNQTIYMKSLPEIGIIAVVVIAVIILLGFKRKSTREIRESENNLSSLFKAMSDIVFEMDYNGTYINIAPTSPELLFTLPREAIGKKLHDVFPKTEADRFLKFIQSVIEQNKILTIEYSLIIDNKIYWFEGKATPKLHDTVLFIARDITEHKQAEKEITDKTILLDNVMNRASNFAVAITDLDLRIAFFNPMAEKFFGYTAQQVIGKTIHEIHVMENVESERLDRALQIVEKTGEYNYTVIQDLDNGKRVLSSRVTGMIDASGKLTGYVLFSSDITELYMAEQDLRQSEEKFQQLYDDAPDMYFSVAMDGTIVSVNQFGAECLGYEISELIGEQVWKVVYSGDLVYVKKEIANIVERNDGISELIFRKIRKDNSVISVQERIQIVSNEEGEKTEIRIICRDVTDQQKQQEDLKQERDTLARFKKVTITRELNLIKLKTEINELLKELGKKPKFKVTETRSKNN